MSEISAQYSETRANFCYTISVGEQRRYELDYLHQFSTYRLLLDGKPDARLNELVVKQALEEARRISPRCQTVTLSVEPGTYTTARGEVIPYLPRVTCIAAFKSDLIPGTDDQLLLNFLWFQDRLAPPIADRIIAEICAADWEHQARRIGIS